MSNDLAELLRGEAWLGTAALFNRSSFAEKGQFTTWLEGLRQRKEAQTRFGAFGLEVALPGTPEPVIERGDAKGPEAPAGAGPMPGLLTAPTPLLVAPRLTGHLEQPEAKPAPVISTARPDPAAPAQISTTEKAMPVKKQNPSGSGSHTHGVQIREKAIALLTTAPQTTAQLAEALGLTGPAMKHHLKLMRKAGTARLDGRAKTAVWHVGKTSSKPGVSTATAKSKPLKRVPADSVAQALEELEQRMRLHPVERLELKLRVLDRLSGIVDPTIAAVLGEIRADLAQ